LLTYEGQKPPTPEFHDALVKWVRNGGALVVVDNDDDPYNAVREWWNTAPLAYKTPREDLFDKLGIPQEAVGLQKAGRGVVVREALSPAKLTYQTNGARKIRSAVRQAAKAIQLPLNETNSLVLRRGPYVIAAGLDESVPDTKPYVLRGRYLNLFDPELAVQNTITIAAGNRMLLLDLNRVKGSRPQVVAAACRIRDEHSSDYTLEFRADGIADTKAIVAVSTRVAPSEVLVAGQPLPRSDYSYAEGVLRMHFQNSVEAVKVEMRF
jgi:hypothetical protein